MTFQDIIHFIVSVVLGKSKPGMDADPMILFGWICVSGLFVLAAKFASPPRAPGLAIGAVGVALLLSGSIVFKVIGVPSSQTVSPTKIAKPPTTTPGIPGGVTTPPFGKAGAGNAPSAPAYPSVRFTRLDNIALTGRPLETPRALSLLDCEQRCSKDTQCAAIVHAEGMCALKLDEGARAPVPGAVSGIKAK
jgi:hypothetical protein